MPALSASSEVVGGVCIPFCSHITNNDASAFVRTQRNDIPYIYSHNRNMARRGVPTQINWYLREWMDLLRVKQADMCRRTDWSKATMSQLYNNKQDYSPKLVNEAAAALNIEPFELLMKPERAMALRRQREAALVLAHDADANPENEAAAM
jgi:transcriptional regulator with XRE-family HTH domain